MKKIILNYSLAMVLITVSFTSCNNDINNFDEMDDSAKKTQTRSLEVQNDVIAENLKIRYKEKLYTATCQYLNDSLISIDNKEVELLFCKLDTMSDLVTFMYPDGSFEYFDNQIDFHANMGRISVLNDSLDKIKHPQTRERIPGCDDKYDANLFLFNDPNYEGRRANVYLGIGQKSESVAHLKPNYAMNDKTTSFAAYSIGGKTLFELFEDDNYRSHCFSFLISLGTNEGINSGERNIPSRGMGMVVAPNLKNVHVRGTRKSSWNDRITSVRMTRQ